MFGASKDFKGDHFAATSVGQASSVEYAQLSHFLEEYILQRALNNDLVKKLQNIMVIV